MIRREPGFYGGKLREALGRCLQRFFEGFDGIRRKTRRLPVAFRRKALTGECCLLCGFCVGKGFFSVRDFCGVTSAGFFGGGDCLLSRLNRLLRSEKCRFCSRKGLFGGRFFRRG